MRFFILILILIFFGCASTPKWKTSDKILFSGFTLMNGMDALQTREIKKDHNGFKELNPGLREVNSDQAMALFASYNIAIYIAADQIPKYRTSILVFSFTLASLFVANNFNIGVKF